MNKEPIKKKSSLQTFSDMTKVRFINKLSEAMNGLSNNAFAALCGLNERTIRKYIRGEAYPTLESLASISFATNKPIEWFVEDIGLKSENDNFLTIPDFYLKVAAGNGLCLIREDDSIGKFILNKDWLRKHQLISANLAIFHVEGDSMESTIHDGDIALVNVKEEGWTGVLNGIFILRVDDLFFIKRIQVDPIAKGMHVISDNPAYKSNFVKFDEASESSIKIIAKVERILTKPPIKNE